MSLAKRIKIVLRKLVELPGFTIAMADRTLRRDGKTAFVTVTVGKMENLVCTSSSTAAG